MLFAGGPTKIEILRIFFIYLFLFLQLLILSISKLFFLVFCITRYPAEWTPTKSKNKSYTHQILQPNKSSFHYDFLKINMIKLWWITLRIKALNTSPSHSPWWKSTQNPWEIKTCLKKVHKLGVCSFQKLGVCCYANCVIMRIYIPTDMSIVV